MSKKYLDTVGLNKLVANILSKFAAKNHSHSNATTNSAGFMSSSDKVKLDGVSTGANRTIVDSTLSSTSVNAIQNKAVKAALDGKAASSHTHPTAQITGLDAALAGKAPSSHTHTIANVTNLQSALDAKQPKGNYAAASHSHAWSSITEKPPTFAPSSHSHTSLAYGSRVDGTTDWNTIPAGVHSVSSTSFNASKHAPVGAYTYGTVMVESDGSNINQIYVAHQDGEMWFRNRFSSSNEFSNWQKVATSYHTHPTAQIRGLDSALAGKAAASHKHDASDITSGVLPIGRGGTGGSSNRAAQNNLFAEMDDAEFTTVTDTTLSVIAAPHNHTTNKDKGRLRLITASKLWSYIKSKTDPLYQPRGSYAASSHTHSIANITNLQSQLDGKQPKGSYAASSHTHTISNVTNLQTELDKKQVKQTPVTTSGTGSAYTANVPHIKSLTAGMKFTMVPNVVSTAVSPTLNVNNLGAKAIRQRLSNSTQSTVTGVEANWLAAGKPVDVMYDGQFWVVDFVRPNMASAYGVLPVENGGTGVNLSNKTGLPFVMNGRVNVSEFMSGGNSFCYFDNGTGCIKFISDFDFKQKLQIRRVLIDSTIYENSPTEVYRVSEYSMLLLDMAIGGSSHYSICCVPVFMYRFETNINEDVYGKGSVIISEGETTQLTYTVDVHIQAGGKKFVLDKVTGIEHKVGRTPALIQVDRAAIYCIYGIA